MSMIRHIPNVFIFILIIFIWVSIIAIPHSILYFPVFWSVCVKSSTQLVSKADKAPTSSQGVA